MEHRIFRWGSLLVMGALLIHVMVERARPDDEQNGLSMMLSFIVMGVVGAVLFATWLLPTIGDKMSEALVSSGEKMPQTPGSRVARHLVEGDYEGAIAELQRQSLAAPLNPKPVLEISRLHHEKLADTGSAVQSLRTALVSREWPPADEATLRFRLADLMLMLTPPAFSTAEAEVQTVLDKFPGTTQAGDAESKRRELREKKFLASRLD